MKKHKKSLIKKDIKADSPNKNNLPFKLNLNLILILIVYLILDSRFGWPKALHGFYCFLHTIRG